MESKTKVQDLKPTPYGLLKFGEELFEQTRLTLMFETSTEEEGDHLEEILRGACEEDPEPEWYVYRSDSYKKSSLAQCKCGTHLFIITDKYCSECGTKLNFTK